MWWFSLLDFIKKNYVNLCIASVYIVLACLVYGIWSYSAWHLWYVTFIIVIAIMIAGVLVSYFWLRKDKKENQPDCVNSNKSA